MAGNYKKESVELNSVYQIRGSGMPEVNKRTIPHTWIVWDVCTRWCIATTTIQEMSAVRSSLLREIFQISYLRQKRKTLSICLLFIQ